jgi:hypothetical protein
MSNDTPSTRRAWIVVGALAVLVVATLSAEIVATRPVRGAVTAYTALLSAANRQDLDALRRLCTDRYLQAHPLKLAREGGVVGLPRNIHKNFQAWRQGPNVWICPTNRVGPLYQFVFEAGAWRFDGPIGLLRSRGVVVPLTDLPDIEAATSGDPSSSDPDL